MVVDLYEALDAATPATTSGTSRYSQSDLSSSDPLPLAATVERMQREIARLDAARRRSAAEAGHLRRQLREATRTQCAQVPRRIELCGVDVHTLYRPIDGVGGDVFAVERLSDRELALNIGDVSGHGLCAAMMAPLLQSALAPCWHDGCDVRTGEISAVMRRANHEMLAFERRDGLCATAIHARYNAATRMLAFARAGHPHPFLLRPGARPQPLKVDGLLLGALTDAEWSVHEVQLQPGDRVLFHTDGLETLLATHPYPRIDDRCVRSWLSAHHDQTTEALLADVHERMDQADWPAAAADDVTLAIMAVRP
jgi:serine phosphatase RsbU (regulator of sigma subunit)